MAFWVLGSGPSNSLPQTKLLFLLFHLLLSSSSSSSSTSFRATQVQKNFRAAELLYLCCLWKINYSSSYNEIQRPHRWGRFFIASDRSDWSSPVCLSFFYSSEHFVLRFFITDWSRRSVRIFVGVLCQTSATPICLFFLCAKTKDV